VRKLIIALVLLLTVIFVISRFSEMQDILAVLVRGNFWFVVLAIVLQLFWLFNLGLTYQAIYRILEIDVQPIYMSRLAIAMNFINVVAPAAGLSSMALLIDDARGRGRSPGRAVIGSVLFLWLECFATLIVLTFGLGELARRNNLHWPEITASLILLAGALIIAALLYLGMRSANLLARVLIKSTRLLNRVVFPLMRREYISEMRANAFAFEAAEGISTLRSHPRLVLRPVILALLNKTLLIGILTLIFLAFKLSLDASTIVASFSLAYLFLIVSPTPAGIGIVEGVMTVALKSLHVPIEDAAVVTLAYRGITFWMPMLVGFFAFRTLRIK
jgi:glycosyltransferase 2 family protein